MLNFHSLVVGGKSLFFRGNYSCLVRGITGSKSLDYVTDIKTSTLVSLDSFKPSTNLYANVGSALIVLQRTLSLIPAKMQIYSSHGGEGELR